LHEVSEKTVVNLAQAQFVVVVSAPDELVLGGKA
jgi:hypothetical protein